MLLYVIRHGDPIYNPDSLTPKGKRQAEAVARRLSVHGLDRIFSSPLGRARKTLRGASLRSSIRNSTRKNAGSSPSPASVSMKEKTMIAIRIGAIATASRILKANTIRKHAMTVSAPRRTTFSAALATRRLETTIRSSTPTINASRCSAMKVSRCVGSPTCSASRRISSGAPSPSPIRASTSSISKTTSQASPSRAASHGTTSRTFTRHAFRCSTKTR